MPIPSGGNAKGRGVHQPWRSAFSPPGQLSFRTQKFQGRALTACSAGSFHFLGQMSRLAGEAGGGAVKEPDEVIHTGDTIGGCSLC